MKLRWKNQNCSERGLRLMEQAVQEVESQVLQSQSAAILANEKPPDLPHLPTAINDKLYPQCIAVCVTPNCGEGSCFRGMECTQWETMNKVYNIGIVVKQAPTSQ
eukprot:Platyproteum_vivax@DN4490_c0_g1_i1.p1